MIQIGFLAAAAAAGTASEPPPAPPPSLVPLAENVWIHQSYAYVEPWGRILSQGLVTRDGETVALVDTAWTDADTADLLKTVEETVGAVDLSVSTHAHDDKMGGVGALKAAGVDTFALDLSNADAPRRGLEPAARDLASKEREWRLPGGLTVFYPGPGHTRDNIVVYHAASKTLFGGCLIRPGAARNLGNTADGDVQHWAQAVENAASRFPAAQIVVPSHGLAGGRDLLDHTAALARAAAASEVEADGGE